MRLVPLARSAIANAWDCDLTSGPFFEPLCSLPPFHRCIVFFTVAAFAFFVRGFAATHLPFFAAVRRPAASIPVAMFACLTAFGP